MNTIYNLERRGQQINDHTTKKYRAKPQEHRKKILNCTSGGMQLTLDFPSGTTEVAYDL